MSQLSRRAALAGIGAALAALLARPFSRASAQGATLVSLQVPQVPTDPEDGLWRQAGALQVPLAPQVVVKPRTYQGGVKAIAARSLYDDERIAFLLEWGDPAREVSLGGVDSFRDAVAVEFPADPSAPKPYFGMGEHNNPVVIYHWKADWQFARDFDVDEEFPHMVADYYPFSGRPPGEIAEGADYGRSGADRAFNTSWQAGSNLANPDLQGRTPVEKLAASGFGSVEPAPTQDGAGNAAWKDGAWKAVISIPRAQEGFSFDQGATFPVAFAAWDGAHRERGGEKSISTWYFLSLEQPSGAFTFISPIIVGLGLLLAQVIGLRLLRRKNGPPSRPVSS